MSGDGHTPGPWLVQNERNGEWSVWTRQPHIGTLASVHCEDINGEYPAAANARLIAAAPDLLEAHLAWEAAEDARNDCTDAEDGCDNEGPWEACPLCSVRFGKAIDMRHTAIAKATGAA